MKLGYTVWTWMVKEKNLDFFPVDDTKFYFEQSLKEIKSLGYEVVENFDFIADFYMNDTNEFNELMEKYGLKFVNLYNYFSKDFEADLKKTEQYCKFLNKVGARQMNIQALMWMERPADRPIDLKTTELYCVRSNKLGKLCSEYGIELIMHPHANTNVYWEKEIDFFLDNTDPNYVGLCLDTAHTATAGMDNVRTFNKYFDRLKYVHLKDAYPDAANLIDWPLYNFRELGHGTVDFKGVYDLLVKRNYDGVLCVELDRPRICNYESAMVSREYLKKVIGI